MAGDIDGTDSRQGGLRVAITGGFAGYQASGARFYDADRSGAGAAVQFATLGPGMALAASDFQVI